MIILPFECRRDAKGWTVFDRWTGHAVILEGHEQVGLGWEEADNLATCLNQRRLRGDRSVLQ